jgi:Na+-translocating ferredoxin:NAD+ oxidoreductase RNF subunit RnfB
MGHLVGKDLFRRLGSKLDGLETRTPWNDKLHAILKELYSPEEADVVIGMPYGLSTLERLEKVTGYRRSDLQRILAGLTAKGLVMDLWIGDAYRYVPSPLVIGVFEFTMMRMGPDAKPREWAKLMHDYIDGDGFLAANLGNGERYTTFRALPYEGSVAPSEHAEILDHEKASALIAGAKRFSIGVCSCRHEQQHLGTKRCHVPLEKCSAFGSAADFLIRNQLAREVSRSEMEENFARSREMGLVLIADNVRTNMKFVCHCCPCCCNLLRAINVHGYPNQVVTSSFVAEIDAKECSGCEACMEACPVHAISVPAAKARAAGATPLPSVDAALCLGCGVCALQCTTGACALKRRGQRVIHPETTFERLILQCLERGTLQNQIFDDPGRIDHKFMRAFVGGFLRLAPVKQALLSDRMRSRFLDAMKGAVRKKGRGWALQV